jgi:drug/metabolite transporter (DMT)-like permease
VIKLGLFSLPPFLAAGIRFFLAFLMLSFYAILKKIAYPRGIKTHVFFIWFGIVNFTGGYALVYWGEQFISSGLASVLFAVMPFYVLILSIWFLKQESINWKKIFGVFIGFCGVVLIFADQIAIRSADHNVIIGMSVILIAPFFSASGTIAGKRARQKMNPVVLVTLPILYASVSFFALSYLFEQKKDIIFDFNAVFSIIYLALAGTAIAFVLYFWMLKNTSAVLMSMITFVTPPLALIWGWIILDEPVTILLVFGMMLILTGIFIVRR